jgi:hypothetical protein
VVFSYFIEAEKIKMIALIIIAAVAIIGALIYLSLWLAAKRRKELTDWGAAHGLAFSPAKDASMESRFPAFSCLRTGDHRYAYNLLTGKWADRDYLSFDYQYETHSSSSKGGTQTQHHYFSAVVLSSPVPLKPLSIRPEGLFDKLAEFFGFEDIHFESAEFSRTFHVKSPDKKWAYDVIHQRTMEFMLGMPRFSLQFEGHSAIAWRHSTFKTQDFEQAAEMIKGILDRLPDYLVQQQMSQP